jgi:hypothetical protein
MYEKRLWSKKGREQPFFMGPLCDLLRSPPLENDTGHSKHIVMFKLYSICLPRKKTYNDSSKNQRMASFGTNRAEK